MKPTQQLHVAGVSLWLDSLRRGLVTGGGLARLIQKEAITGVTANPTIFRAAIGGSTDYDPQLRRLAADGPRAPLGVYYDLALEDIRMVADLLRPVYEASRGADGFVSFELEPRLAHDAVGSTLSALELSERIGRPNVMIKVPGTEEGVRAVEELTAAAVNVNITLLFSVQMHEKVALAYIAGLERRLAGGEPVDGVASVASFFLSRVDSVVDELLPEDSPLRGKIAVANAKTAYRRFTEIFAGERWGPLAAAGAKVQRPLWASTGTKDPQYPDLLYVEPLIGPDVVNTMPPRTFDALRDHGRVKLNTVSEGLAEAEVALAELPEHGIDLREVASGLTEKGIEAFEKDLDALLETIDRKLSELGAGRARGPASVGSLEKHISDRLDRMTEDDIVARIWRKDHTVWKPSPDEITDRLGWLDVADVMEGRVAGLEAFAQQASADGFTRAVLLGMGGSSLAPEVLRRTLGAAHGALDLVVLDTTHPATIASVEATLDLDRTLFIVASKSGSTIETMSHFAYFFSLAGSRGDRFVAITDPGTSLAALAREYGFRRTFLNPPDIGGRYSALSYFGLVPAALLGADLRALLDSASEMAVGCEPCVPCDENPGAWLGAVIGEAVREGRDKLTFVLPRELDSLGAWLEQLIAESTGKEGTWIVPVDGEALGPTAVYGDDRLFVVLGDAGGVTLGALEEAGHLVIRLASAPASLGAEFYRWEFATAVAGHVLGINPFDQPNVAEAKEQTAKILSEGARPEEAFDDLEAFLAGVKPGDYVAIQAFIDPTPEAAGVIERARLAIRDRGVATTVGYGPRFLHSTGQLHKGGPDTGAFIQVVDTSRTVDRPIPGVPHTFGALIDAQAAGDLRSLRARGRRVARTTLGALGEVG